MRPAAADLPSAPLRIRLAAELYELFLLAALWVAVAAGFTALFGDAAESPRRTLLQLALVAATTAYFGWSWSGGRRTLAMRTWRLVLLAQDGNYPSIAAATLRALVAIATVPTGLSLVWALFDRDRRFFHDRLMRTRLVREPSTPAARRSP